MISTDSHGCNHPSEAVTLELEKEKGLTEAFICERYSEIRLNTRIKKVSDNPNRTSLPSVVSGVHSKKLPVDFTGTWTGVTMTWPTNQTFKIVLNRNGTGKLLEGFSKTACRFQKTIEHTLFWTLDEKGQCRGLSVVIVQGKTVDNYDFEIYKEGPEYLFKLQKNDSDLVDVAKIRRVL